MEHFRCYGNISFSSNHNCLGFDGYAVQLTHYYRLALDKDPEYVRALVVMGQALLQNGQEAKAIEYLESAISKV